MIEIPDNAELWKDDPINTNNAEVGPPMPKRIKFTLTVEFDEV